MSIPRRARLVEQLHCLSDDGGVVITTQRWDDPAADPDRPRSWVQVLHNGRVVQTRSATGRSHPEMVEALAEIRERYEQSSGLTEEQMWEALRRRVGIEQARCAGKDCSGAAPVGSSICQLCGKDVRRVARGSLTGVYRRGVIVVPASALRTTEPKS